MNQKNTEFIAGRVSRSVDPYLDKSRFKVVSNLSKELQVNLDVDPAGMNQFYPKKH